MQHVPELGNPSHRMLGCHCYMLASSVENTAPIVDKQMLMRCSFDIKNSDNIAYHM